MRSAILTCSMVVLLAAATTVTADPPSWDTTRDANRFKVLAAFGDEAVLDRETGLVWTRTPGAGSACHIEEVPWAGAHSCCARTVVGERRGWRLPSHAEFTSLATGSTLAPGHPFLDVTTAYYWTSSVGAASDGNAVAISVPFFEVAQATKNLLSFRYWCVRAPGGND